MFHLLTKSHKPTSSTLLVMVIKPKVKDNVDTAAILLYWNVQKLL
jgi:hypothetical protein